MRTAPISFAALLLIAGCSSVSHDARIYQPVGTSLPVEVQHSFDDAQFVEGVVHYRTAPSGLFEDAQMMRRADQLWTILPTDHLEPDEFVEYYIDVNGDGKLYALGSPGQPYVTTFLDRTGMILSTMHTSVHAEDTASDVTIVLHANNAPIDQPYVEYVVPDVPGVVRAPLNADSFGNYVMVIPSHAVRAGSWQYAIETPIDGQVFRIPENGFATFDVFEAAQAHHADASDEN